MLKAEPYLPTGVLKPFGTECWIVDGPVIRMRYLVGAIPFPTRMVVARLEDRGLWLWSPVPWSEALAAELAELGPVRALVAPNRLHVSWLGEWMEACPEAESWGAPGTPEAARAQGLSPPARILSEPGPWAGEVETALFPGAFMTEAVFFHRASRTLVLADLIENFEADKLSGCGARTLMRMAGTLAPDGSTPRDLRLTFLPHRAGGRAAAERMRDWGPERIVMAHGAPIETGAGEALRRAFAWTGMA